MPAYTTESHERGGRHQVVATVLFVLLAVVLNFLPGEAQQEVAGALQSTVLRPFMVVQEGLAEARVRATESSRLRDRLDSLVAAVTARTHMEEENRRLRGLLSLSRRLDPSYRAASVIRPGTAGSESMFVLDVGAEDGVVNPAPVITRHGLVGSIRDVRERSAIGMDWTHPDFRASATTLDGTTTGMVVSQRGDFREQDRLVLQGTAFHTTLEEGTVIVTSGLGGVYPRGIPIGRVRGLSEAAAGWRKSYWLEPFVDPGDVTHVLVLTEAGEGGPTRDAVAAWPRDSIVTDDDLMRAEQARRDSLAVREDSLRMLRAILAAQSTQDSLRAAMADRSADELPRPTPPARAPAGRSEPAEASGGPATVPSDTATVDTVGTDTTGTDTVTVDTVGTDTVEADTTVPDTSGAPPDTNRVRLRSADHVRSGGAGDVLPRVEGTGE